MNRDDYYRKYQDNSRYQPSKYYERYDNKDKNKYEYKNDQSKYRSENRSRSNEKKNYKDYKVYEKYRGDYKEREKTERNYNKDKEYHNNYKSNSRYENDEKVDLKYTYSNTANSTYNSSELNHQQSTVSTMHKVPSNYPCNDDNWDTPTNLNNNPQQTLQFYNKIEEIPNKIKEKEKKKESNGLLDANFINIFVCKQLKKTSLSNLLDLYTEEDFIEEKTKITELIANEENSFVSKINHITAKDIKFLPIPNFQIYSDINNSLIENVNKNVDKVHLLTKDNILLNNMNNAISYYNNKMDEKDERVKFLKERLNKIVLEIK
jgi:hypothetical protein